MLTIEHCENLHIQLPDRPTILSEAIKAGLDLDKLLRNPDPVAVDVPGRVQTFATASPPCALGEVLSDASGYYAGTMPAMRGKPGYHLVLASEQAEDLKFGPYEHDVEGAKDHYDGLANTDALVRDSKDHPAAKWAKNIVVRPHTDWYLPAHNELMLMWICVPHLFKKEGYYWSSTQYSPYGAWVQGFEYGYSDISSKHGELRAVAVRRLAL